MTASAIDHEARPRLRADVEIGPAIRQGIGIVHHVRDAATGWYYRVGPREHFVFSRLDGGHSLDEIGRDYAATFGRRLGEANWIQLFELLRRRQLLSDTADEAVLDELRQRRAAEEEREGRPRGTLLSRRWVLIRPDRMLGRLAAHLPMFYSPWFVWPTLVAVLAAEVLLFANLGDLYRDLRSGRGAAEVLVPLLIGGWLVHAVHECAHGITCKRFGGTVPEIGVMWRFPLLVPYCRTDGLMLFPTHRRRVFTAFAGVFSGLLLAVPFAALWWLAPPGHLRAYAAAMLLTCGLGQLANFVPFLRLDGYYMLTYALGMVDLRGETYRFWGYIWRRDRAALHAYRKVDFWIYGLYGLGTVGFAVAFSAFLTIWWYDNLRRWTGSTSAVGILAAEATLIISFVVIARRRSNKPTV